MGSWIGTFFIRLCCFVGSMEILYLRNLLSVAHYFLNLFLFFLVIFSNGFWDFLENILKQNYKGYRRVKNGH